MSRQFTTEAEKALNKAAKFAIRMGQRIVGSEHLLFGLSAAPGVAARVLKENGMDKERIDIEVREYCGMSDVVEIEPLRGETSPKLEALLLAAAEEAGKMQLKETGTEHMLLAILKDTSCVAYKILLASGAPIQKLYTDIILTTGGDMVQAKNELIASRSRNKKNSGTPTLDQYARDLTQYAKDGKLDPVLNRDDEIESVIGILSRRMKNNPCLIGEPGVGKTAIVEGLASRIVDGAVPDTLEQKRILTLDLSGMVAGSKYRGEFEERIKRALRETKAAGNILLFIDELHTVIGAGGAEGAIDASNILKPAMARGEIQVIGATTREEYRKHIEKDAALERRFQPVVIEEPSAVQTISMLKGLRSRYEEFHKVEITDAAIEAAVQLSERYLNDRYLPDKAIDLIDEASAKFHLQTVYAQSDRTQEYEKEREDLYEQKEQALIAGDLERVRELLAAEKKLEKKIEKEEELKQEQRQKKDKILPSHIAQVVAKWTHIPVEQMEEAEKERLKKLDAILHERVVGQNDAVKAVARAIRRGRVGLKDPKRPIGSFLFLGPTGVGKTELSKALAEAVFGSEKDMIRVDMSEYMEKQSVSKMIGSPPGYVGYEEGGQLSEKVRRKPYSVLLFDEIEKAHPDVFNMLLQVLEDGHITDAHGKKVDFKNTIIIMTSNAGANRIISPKTLGFGQAKTSEEEYQKMKEGVMEEVKHIFKPEFINRVDEMIVFHALNKENIKDITKIMLKQFAKRVKNQMDMELCIADDVVDFISDKGFDKDYGARPIRRALQTELEDVLAEAVLMGDISIGDTVDVSLSCEGTKKKIVVKKKTFADEKK
ncbi:ATP-dependent Clp protease ATP-binding subunit [Clostridium sp. AF37-5]|uniref:ATP-dependent Clp protease ATP-binding subunit n=1 Tax=Clostridium sp. AF37-5 TaxID=2293016 RepID=UPI000E470800|nr:ATP-dependent Clp protease ATP-binding subunit [Clostridium sp. AF37-5]RHO98291.1 ATP-dependent Clp protease ATP-binding subunit [Clostridium sp. AF37-5]